MSSSLEGVRVLDLSRLAAGNMISHMLADHGADVIKVERPEKGRSEEHTSELQSHS